MMSASMRISDAPLEYEMASKISLTSAEFLHSTSIGCDDLRESRPRARSSSSPTKRSQIRHSGKRLSTASQPTQVAKPSFSHRWVHHCIVTKLPNHWCASSWHTTYAMSVLFWSEVRSALYSRYVERYVTRPQFSIAPAAKSAIATMSILGSGYGSAKNSVKYSSVLMAQCRGKAPSAVSPTGVHTATSTPSLVFPDTFSNSPTTMATRYDDMIGVVSNRTVRVPSPFLESLTTGMFPRATKLSGTVSVTLNRALTAGSSQHGNARRASVASNCVTAPYFSSPAAFVYLLR
mmetsp:Transcript_21651/g.56511  ORF Transcript_21651/g.56511 Transcript_21651/m.56511 type:complete len:291 (-) Transcript_21651:554-1426(-)